MKNFKIEVIADMAKKVRGILSYYGQITIGDFTERFLIPVSDWSIEDYKKQWEYALTRIQTHNESCFIVSARYVNGKPRMGFWKMYKVDKNLFFQNQLLGDSFIEKLSQKFQLPPLDFNSCYLYIKPRIANEKNEGINEEGDKLAEWSISME